MTASKHPLDLASKMEELRQRQSCTDVVMECAGGVVHAHKCILLTSCSYFEKMFTVDMTENITGCVRFNDIPSKVIEMIIKYLYVAEIPALGNDCDSLRELIATSRMMGLEDLLINCWKQTTNDLNAEKFAKLWAVGVDFGLEKEGTIETFAQNNMKEISENSQVQDLTKTQLTKLIECLDHKQFCNECILCLFKWKSSGDEAVTIKLLETVDLQHLNNTSLYDLLQNTRSDEKKETMETLLTREAVARLPKFSEANLNISKQIIAHCNRHCIYNVYACPATIALKVIRALCIKLLE